MSKFSTLPSVPNIKLEVLETETLPEQGFIRVQRNTFRAYYPNDNISEPFTIDTAIRERLDAVVILAHFSHRRRYIYFRSAIRPALMVRDYQTSKLYEEAEFGNQWELPAGLVELNETGVDGLKRAASREMEEELGFKVSPDKFNFLGKRTFPSPGAIAERLFFLEVEVDPHYQQTPTLDGHPLEEGGQVCCIPLDEALELVYAGYLTDTKTELGLLRFARRFPFKSDEND